MNKENNEEELSPTDLEKLVESLVLSKILSGDLDTESEDAPELTEEQMNELLAKVRENFGDNK
jgi:hypothetical protein